MTATTWKIKTSISLPANLEMIINLMRINNDVWRKFNINSISPRWGDVCHDGRKMMLARFQHSNCLIFRATFLPANRDLWFHLSLEDYGFRWKRDENGKTKSQAININLQLFLLSTKAPCDETSQLGLWWQ